MFVVLAIAGAAAEIGPAGTPAIQGDANCDGSVGPDDALAVLSLEAGVIAASSDCAQARGDTDCSGAADNADVLAILRYVLASPALPADDDCAAIGGQLATPTVIAESSTPTPTATVEPTVAPTVSPTPTATPVPGCAALEEGGDEAGGVPEGTPGALNYTMVRLPADAHIDKLTNVAPVPGDPDLAVVTSESGTVWTVCLHDALPRTEILDLSAYVRDFNDGHESDEGLVGFTFDPIDPSYVYINYSMPKNGGTYLEDGATPSPDTVRSRISRFHIDDNGRIDRHSEKVILDVYQPFEWQNANELAFGPDGMLYISSGSGGLDREKGQTLDDLWGAVLRIDVHSSDPYSIPPDNPFVDGPGGNADEVWAYGFRNPWRFTFDNGKMWLTDVGAVTWEELNIVEAGANYGWPIMEGYNCFTAPDAATPVPTCDAAGLATPRLVYDHDEGCAIIGGDVYHGAKMPELGGYYIYGDLCTGKIWGLDTQDDNSEPILLVDTALFPVSWAIMNEGDIVVANYYNPRFPGDAGIYQLERVP